MFSKLDIQHQIPLEPYGDIYTQFGINTPNGFSGIAYHHISSDIQDQIFNTCPWAPRSAFNALLMVINRMHIPPHNDDGIKVSINLYIDTADAVTTFHRNKKSTAAGYMKLPNQTNGSIYNAEDLEPVAQFKAQSGEIYVLDVTSLHSVDCGTSNIRTAYVIQSPFFSYDQTMESYKKYYDL